MCSFQDAMGDACHVFARTVPLRQLLQLDGSASRKNTAATVYCICREKGHVKTDSVNKTGQYDTRGMRAVTRIIKYIPQNMDRLFE